MLTYQSLITDRGILIVEYWIDWNEHSNTRNVKQTKDVRMYT